MRYRLIYFFAQDYQRAAGRARLMRLKNEQWKFIDSVDDLNGTRCPTVFVCEDAYFREDYIDIVHRLKAHTARMWKEDDLARKAYHS